MAHRTSLNVLPRPVRWGPTAEGQGKRLGELLVSLPALRSYGFGSGELDSVSHNLP